MFASAAAVDADIVVELIVDDAVAADDETVQSKNEIEIMEYAKRRGFDAINSPKLGADAVVSATVDVGAVTAATAAAIFASRLCSCGVCC